VKEETFPPVSLSDADVFEKLLFAYDQQNSTSTDSVLVEFRCNVLISTVVDLFRIARQMKKPIDEVVSDCIFIGATESRDRGFDTNEAMECMADRIREERK
jgi:hypothetical protein